MQQFPIPMRGNEFADTGAEPMAVYKFPIPMRGNEIQVIMCVGAFYWVSNPHEG